MFPLIEVVTYLPFWVVGIRLVSTALEEELDTALAELELEDELEDELELDWLDATLAELEIVDLEPLDIELDADDIIAVDCELDEDDWVTLLVFACSRKGENSSTQTNNITPRSASINQKNLFRKVSVFCITKSESLKIFELK